jgi:methylmalonyl-CoA mutase cobalamin-binding subunit
VPDREEAALLEVGVARVFHPGSPLEEIVDVVCQLTAKRRTKPALSLKEAP